MERSERKSSELVCLVVVLLLSVFVMCCCSFNSDELLQDDDEFGLEGTPKSPDLDYLNPSVRSSSSRKRSSDVDSSSSSSSDSKIQFTLYHSFGDESDFSVAGTFTARLKTLHHGGQTLTKLRFSRNSFTDTEKEKFKKLLEDDEYYRIRIPSNVLSPPGKDYAISSVKARCLSKEGLDEHFVIHMEGVNILAVNYGATGACQYPRPLKFPAKWSFNSYTVLKNSEVAPRTPTFAEELLAAENVEGEGVTPQEKSFWSKYWMYLIPLGLVFMNAITQAMNMPEEQATGQSASQGQQIPQRTANPAIRRR